MLQLQSRDSDEKLIDSLDKKCLGQFFSGTNRPIRKNGFGFGFGPSSLHLFNTFSAADVKAMCCTSADDDDGDDDAVIVVVSHVAVDSNA